jgi:RNA polymerase sigma-70 factor (ECF subfamily)
MSEAALDFEKIHADLRPKILRYLARLVGELEAEDLTQEVFVRVSQAMHTFRGESQLSTWIYRIATNAAVDRLRSPSFKRFVEDGPMDMSGTGEAKGEGEDIRTGQEIPLPEEQLFFKERYECYRDFIQDLPLNYRTVVALSDLGEFAANEIAEILGLSLGVTKVRLHRGRARLLQELKKHCKAEDWL